MREGKFLIRGSHLTTSWAQLFTLADGCNASAFLSIAN